VTARDQPYADRCNRGHAKRSAEFSWNSARAPGRATRKADPTNQTAARKGFQIRRSRPSPVALWSSSIVYKRGST
jgi:hypothetical protein